MSDPFAEIFVDLSQRIGDTNRASSLMELAMVSLLIDKGVLTADEVIVRIEDLYNKVASLQGEAVLRRIEPLLAELRASAGSTE